MRKFKISVILPAHNEEGNIDEIYKRLFKVLTIYKNYEIIFVDDGSKDNTLAKIKGLSMKNKRVKYISLSRNFGHQNALKAGLDNAGGDCIISLDCDLQHPPELIHAMIQHWLDGYDIVYTIRQERERDIRNFQKIHGANFLQLNKLFI